MKRFVVVEIDADEETCGDCEWQDCDIDWQYHCLLYKIRNTKRHRCNRCIAAESAVSAFRAVLEEIGV